MAMLCAVASAGTGAVASAAQRSTGALQGSGSLLIDLAFSCLNLNWAMWLLSKQATKVDPSSLSC